MSNSAPEKKAQDAAREALLRCIATAAERIAKAEPASQSHALKDLAEAYAFVVHPSQPR